MHRSPAFARLRRLRSVASLVALGLLCRALIPVGFMPAAIGAGGPVVLCNGGLAGEFFLRLEAAQHQANGTAAAGGGHDGHAQHGGHLDHGAPGGPTGPGAPDTQDPAAGHEGWEHCPFGAAFGPALLAADVTVELPFFAHTLEVVEPSLPVSYRPVASYRARAPPSSAIHS